MDWKIEKYDSVGSTQDVAKQLALAGAPEGTIVLADHQNHGRGRGTRTWYSPAGTGLWATCILRPSISPEHLPLLPVLVSISVSHAVERITGRDVFIKWPNDVMLGDRKIAGVLCEAESDPGKGTSLVLAGFGLNMREPEGGFNEEIAGLATSIETEMGSHTDDSSTLDSILASLERLYRRFLLGVYSEIVQEASSRNMLEGTYVKVKVGEKVVEGRSEGLTDRGGLLVRAEGDTLVELTSGEVLEYAPYPVD